MLIALFTLKNLCLKALKARALKYKFFVKVGFWVFISFLKVQDFWEGHPNLLSNGKTKKKISTNLCGLFKIYEFYQTTVFSKLLSAFFRKNSFSNNRCFDILQKLESLLWIWNIYLDLYRPSKNSRTQNFVHTLVV